MAKHTPKKLAPIHPGEVLLHDFLEEMGVSQYKLAKDTSLSATRIGDIVHGRRAITADTALRFGRYFGTSAELWMNLQARYDLEKAKDAVGTKIEHEVHALVHA